MSKKILIVFGHPKFEKGSSFNACLRDEFITESKKCNNEIDLINLYDEPPLGFLDGSPATELVLNYRKRLEQADVMLLMSPCYNYICTPIVENWISHVIQPPFSFTYRKLYGNFGYPQGSALKGKTAIISMSYASPSFFISGIIQQIPRRVKKFLFSYLCKMNVKYLRWYEILPNMPKKIFDKHMTKMRIAAREI